MPKLKKSPIFKYGIEITKPFSKEMYDHNDKVATEMKKNILKIWNEELDKFHIDDEWPTEGKIVDIQKEVQKIGYGDGYIMDDVNHSFCIELETTANWDMHEIYSYLCFKGMVPRTEFMMVGFGWEKMDYAKDDVWKIKEIAKGRLRWSSCSDEDGNHWKEPYIKCDSEGHGNTFVRRLFAEGIEAVVDLYEDEDGDDDYGRTIIRKIWSVRIKNVKK